MFSACGCYLRSTQPPIDHPRLKAAEPEPNHLEGVYVSAMDITQGSRSPNADDSHLACRTTLYFLNGPPPTIRIGQQFNVTIRLSSTQTSHPSLIPTTTSEAIHLSLRIAEDNSAANLLGGNLTSTVTRIKGHTPSSITVDGIHVTKIGRFRLRALLGVNSVAQVTITSTLDSDVFEVTR